MDGISNPDSFWGIIREVGRYLGKYDVKGIFDPPLPTKRQEGVLESGSMFRIVLNERYVAEVSIGHFGHPGIDEMVEVERDGTVGNCFVAEGHHGSVKEESQGRISE
jgi:hypothetical protein